MMVELAKNGLENPEETFLDEDPMTFYVMSSSYHFNRSAGTTPTLLRDSDQAPNT
jgi:hypothetical protein